MESPPTTIFFISINGKQIIPAATHNNNNNNNNKQNGQQPPPYEDAMISVLDTSLLRGDGIFEVMKLQLPTTTTTTKSPSFLDNNLSRIRCLSKHMERLKNSAKAIGCSIHMDTLLSWLEQAVATVRAVDETRSNHIDDPSAAATATTTENTSVYSSCCLKLIVTKGSGKDSFIFGHDSNNEAIPIPSSVIILVTSRPIWPNHFTLFPLLAPWHPAGREIPIKWTSYGPNVLSTQKAKLAGFTDALLVTNDWIATTTTTISPTTGLPPVNLFDCHVLEGPNFAVGWITTTRNHYSNPPKNHPNSEVVFKVPCSQSLGLLPSITQGIVVELAETHLNLQVQRGVFTLRELLQEADEVFVMSTTRGIIPVSQIGDKIFDLQNHPWTDRLSLLLNQYTG